MIDQTETLLAIIRSANDAIITADSDGRIITWNPAAEAIFGHSEQEAVGELLTIIIPERFHTQHHEGLARVVGTGETHIIGQTVEVAGLRKDGTEIPIELALATWVTDGDRFFSGIIRDVSERAGLVTALSDSEARLGAILESANDAIITIDSEGRVLLWNAHAAELFGYTLEEMAGRPLTAIIPERFRDQHHAGIHRVVETGETHVIGHTAELTGLTRDGVEFPMELSLAMWTNEGETFFSGIIRDITQRKEAEAELRVANHALAEKNEMLQGLSGKLAKYLSRQVYDSIFEGRTDVRVESYRKELTVFFSDIQGFTELSDRMEAEPLSELLNRYLSEMANIALEHGGTVDKFIGDGVMIFFGDPESRGARDDALACARMAIAMRERAAELQDEWQRVSGAIQLHVRMGMNTGYCTVGNFGSEDRLDYTIVGKEVNAASRLESSALPDQIHLSHTTYELIKDEIECRPVGELRVKGLAYPIRTYEIVDPEAPAGETGLADESLAASLGVDLSSLDADQIETARRALREALKQAGGDAG
ncbi:MAG: PAS domain S-box protein [Acidimicrobiia bacterium]